MSHLQPCTHADEEDEEDFEDMDPQQAAALRQRMALQQLAGLDQDFDDEEDEDDSDFDLESEEDDDEIDSDEEAHPSVVIEDITENGLHGVSSS